eukprot:GDKI01012206.1.p1 GENE.GDKI01012206.1~~GDKI01012206.1.p1  ORF type:complete len:347 (+),score=61.11 GDKI01012206.1:106-1146(+)
MSIELERHQVEEACSYFLEGPILSFSKATGGINNLVGFVEAADGKKWVLRVSNNGNNIEKVKYEHAVLAELGQIPTSFQVPKPLKSKNGNTYEVMKNGAACCMWYMIPGTLAGKGNITAVGSATGELVCAMGQLSHTLLHTSPNPPYWDLFAIHAGVRDGPAFYNEVKTNPGFDCCRAGIDFLAQEIHTLEGEVEKLKERQLPMQLIHADLHFDNVLINDGKASGVLDFEFVANDFRALELAISMSKYVGEPDPLPLCIEFMHGFAQHGKLTVAECAAVPDLIKLRVLSNVIWFTGRAMAGEESLSLLTDRIHVYVKRITWLNENTHTLVEAVTQAMKATGNLVDN